MARKIFDGTYIGYTFDNASDMKDSLEQAILSELDTKQYPLKNKIERIKSGGMFFNTAEQCIVLDTSKSTQVVIAIAPVGSYLYVEMFTTIKGVAFIFLLLSKLPIIGGSFKKNLPGSDDVFNEFRKRAVFSAAQEIVESAFKKLGLKQSDSGYVGEKNVGLGSKKRRK